MCGGESVLGCLVSEKYIGEVREGGRIKTIVKDVYTARTRAHT